MATIALNSYEFEDLRNCGNIYVDKTAYLYDLVSRPSTDALFFIARPRRFGKSLMISTLESIFKGQKELFKGLYIAEKTDYAWPKVPVIRFSLAQVHYSSGAETRASLSKMLRERLPEDIVSQIPADYTSPDDIFRFALLEMCKKGGPVAVLVDEYDTPIAHALADTKIAEEVRQELCDFYGTLKTCVKQIRFLMMTGVSKLTRTSVFSGLNNISDISFSPEYAGMLGYTDAELEAYFSTEMHAHAAVMGLSYEDYRTKLKHWFNGYRFSPSETSVYNPISIALTLTKQEKSFGAPWADMVRPTMLAEFLKTHDILSLPLEDGIGANESTLFKAANLHNILPVQMLYQTGYLTVRNYNTETRGCLLVFPNEEIRRDMYAFIADMRVCNGEDMWCSQSLTDLSYGKPERFLEGLPALYASMNYGSTEANAKPGEKKVKEFNYQRILQGVFRAGGYFPQPECVQSNGGRSDLIIRMAGYVYIIEFKNDRALTAADALQQIRDRGYAKPYLGLGLKICAIGLAFDPETHELTDTDTEWLT